MPGSLYERERERALVVEALDEVAGGRGRAVVVEGPAGIGKTSLLGLARDAALERSFAVANARGTELERAYAWGVVRQLFEPRLRGLSAGARRAALAGAAALAGPVVLPEAAARDAGPGVLPEAAPDAGPDPSFGALHGLYWLVAGLADRRPQLLLVDDLHWVDDASTRFLEFLVNRLDALPVLLLTAQRPSGAPALRGSPLTTTLTLDELSLDATAAMLAERRGAPVAEALAAACRQATGGNPLLLRRLAATLDGTEDAAAVARLGPFAVADAVAAALARLGDAPGRLAAAVAALDRPSLHVAARLAGIDDGAAVVAGEQLARAGILRDARPLEFEHALVRDAVLGLLGAGERARLHTEAAAVLADAGAPPEAVAVQLLHTEPRGDTAVAATLAEAGRRALRRGAPDEAASCLARAVAEPPPDAERSALLLDLARAEHGLGRRAALDHVLEAHAAAGDPVERARVALALAWATGPGRQDPGEAVAMVDAAIAGVRGRERELELRLEALRLAAVVFMGGEALQRDALGDPERFADLDGRTAGECELLPHVAVHRFLTGRSAADVAALAERAVADPQVVAAIGPDSTWLWIVLGLLFKTDRLAVARRTADVALVEAQRRGSAPGFATASVWRAWIALREGSAADAEADARAALDSLTEPTWQRLFPVACLIEVLVERGALAEAGALLSEGPRNGDPETDRAAEFFLYVHSILHEAQGDRAGALAAQLECRRLRGSQADPDPDFDGWLRLARLLHALGEPAAAAREAEGALRWARTWGTPGYLGQALTVTGLLGGGDDGIADLRAAVEQLERSPARRELARSLVELGAALRRRGERVAAREPLRRALDIATAGGLTATAERAGAELGATGARVRRPAATGLESLTPSERRIVDLAAGGASNPEIAQALFVTVKTVEMHLGNAYRKLDVHSRHELGPLVAAG
jgi:ATP/maltotriose-dependent transcriptional regulator MalT